MTEAETEIPVGRDNVNTFTVQDIERFWSKVDKRGPTPDQNISFYAGLNECWNWVGSLSHKGYGHAWVGLKMYQAHRASWVITHGHIPKGLQVLHICDHRKCVNPSHLFLGTNNDNAQDRTRKGRSGAVSGEDHHFKKNPELVPRGVRNAHAKLTDEKVKDYLRLHVEEGYTFTALAKMAGVNSSAIAKALKGVGWAHVDRDPKLAEKVILKRSSVGESNMASILNEGAVREIRKLYAAGGVTQQVIAKQFGVSVPAISKILVGRTWKHVQ